MTKASSLVTNLSNQKPNPFTSLGNKDDKLLVDRQNNSSSIFGCANPIFSNNQNSSLFD